MDTRQATLLIGLVQEYIRTAKPVGSSQLTRLVDLEVSSATVRNLLQELDEEGYVVQPHTSAGRIPTDKGYRYYVDHMQTHLIAEAKRRQIAMQLRESAQQYQQLARATSKLLSKLSHTIAVSRFQPEGLVQEAGLREVLEQPEGVRPEAIHEMSIILDTVDEHLEELTNTEGRVMVYIGQENPYFPAQHTSVVVRSVMLPNSQYAILALVGPKRMAYTRNVALVNLLAQILHTHSL